MTRTLPVANARLLQVREVGQTEDYRSEESEGAVDWQGNVDAYVSEQRRRSQNGQTLDVVVDRQCVVPDFGVTIAEQMLIVLQYDGGELVAHVLDVTHDVTPPGFDNTYTLRFEPT